jgi:hypothetical protein
MGFETQQHWMGDVRASACSVNDINALSWRKTIYGHIGLSIISKVSTECVVHVVAMAIGNQPLSKVWPSDNTIIRCILADIINVTGHPKLRQASSNQSIPLTSRTLNPFERVTQSGVMWVYTKS